MTASVGVTRTTSPRVLFRAACGPRQGYGHLVRVLRLARALGAPPLVSLRGPRSAADVARRLGGRPASPGLDALTRTSARMLVVDDPTEAAVTPWIRAARRLGMPVATIHDLGLGAAGGDLVIDGSLGGPWRRWPTGRTLTGPRYAIVDRRLATVRLERVVGPGGKVLIALGGGPRRRLAARLAAAVLREVPAAHVTIAGGLLPATTQADPRITWLSDPQAFADTLAHATVAVVAGGVTLYESCAAGTPRVALAVVPAQRRTVEAFARAGAAIDAGGPLAGARTRRDVDHVAGLVADVVRDKNVRARLSKTGRRLIDGRGLARVVAELERLYRDGAEKVARG